MVLVGSATHAAVLAVARLRGGARKARLQRLYATVTALAYGVCFALGLAIYPAFRTEVRAAYFDPELPWATALFEVKEHGLGIGLFAVGVYWALSRRIRPRAPFLTERAHAALAVGLAGVVWYATLTGLSLTALRPV